MPEPLTSEEVERRRRRQNRARKLANLGRPQHVLPHEYEYGMSILRRAHESGMSLTQSAAQIGLAKSTLGKLWSGDSATMHRDTYNALLRLQPEPPQRAGGTRRGGAKLDPRTTSRRLQALFASGWTGLVLAPLIGMDNRNMGTLVRGQVRYVYAVTAKEIADLYDKLQYEDPVAHGVSEASASRGRIESRRKGWAPTWAWDDDTIDDPHAFPEWTGACGTEEGYRIHIRETIFEKNRMPPCDPCREAVETVPADLIADKAVMDREAFARILEERSMNCRQLAIRMGTPHSDALYRWRAGERTLRSRAKIEEIAKALDCEYSDLVDQAATDADIARVAVVGRGKFNPYILRMAMEIGEISGHAITRLPGVHLTSTTINNWASGKAAPASQEKLQPIADYFGIDAKEFYQ